jgi:hypothetical protein
MAKGSSYAPRKEKPLDRKKNPQTLKKKEKPVEVKKPRKQRAPRPRKGIKMQVPELPMPVNPAIPSDIETQSQEYRVYSMMLKGYNNKEVAEALGMTTANVRTVLKRAGETASEQISEMQANYLQISLARNEIFMKKVMERMDGAVTEEKLQRCIDMYAKLTRLGMDLIGVGAKPGAAQPAQTNVFVHNTIGTKSPLYGKALLGSGEQTEEGELVVEDYHEYKATEPKDPKILRLEGVLSGNIDAS